MKRIHGFVVGYDKVAGEFLWTVKVKDSSSVHDGQKFLVASLHPETMLTRPGTDVTFGVQPFGTEQEKVLRAVDVSIGKIFPEERQIVERIPKALMIAFFAFTGEPAMAMRTECESVEEVQQWILEGGGGEEIAVGLIRITPEVALEHSYGEPEEDIVASLAMVRQMMDLNPIRDIICAIAAEAFRLGCASKEAAQNQS